MSVKDDLALILESDIHLRAIRARLDTGWNTRLLFLKSYCPKGARALDLGARHGEYTLPLATIAAHVDALDIERGPLANLRAFAIEKQIKNIETSEKDFIAWAQGRAGSYDFCVCTGTWTYLTPESRRAYLRTFRELLRPDGKLLIDFYTPRYFLFRAFIQQLPVKFRAHSALAFFYRRLRRTFVTPQIFTREAALEDFTVNPVESQLYHPCRELEGHNFNTMFGPYWFAYVLSLRQSP